MAPDNLYKVAETNINASGPDTECQHSNAANDRRDYADFSGCFASHDACSVVAESSDG